MASSQPWYLGPFLKKLFLPVDDLPLAEKEKARLRTLIKQRGRIEILVLGREGVGKSTLVSALSAGKAGEEMTAGNMEVVVVWLAPGLKDNSENEQILAEIKKNCGNVDIVIYCIKFAVARAELSGVVEAQQGELLAIKHLTKTLGPDWWKKSIFVMTFANTLQSILQVTQQDHGKKFNDKLDEWKGDIQKALINVGVSKAIANGIAIEPAGHAKKPQLPGRKHWVSEIWSSVMNKCLVQTNNISMAQPVMSAIVNEDTNLINRRTRNRLITQVGYFIVPIGIGATAGGFLGALRGLAITILFGVLIGGFIGAVYFVYFFLHKKY